MTSIRRQCSEELTFSFVETLLQSLWYITASGASVLVLLLPNVRVVFVTINNVQQRIRLNEQNGKNLSLPAFALLPVSHVTHPGHLLLAYGRMEETF